LAAVIAAVNEDPNEHFLGEVLGRLPVVQHAADQVRDPALEAPDELGKRSLVALGDAPHQVLVGESDDGYGCRIAV
jgi:hypothetical protein